MNKIELEKIKKKALEEKIPIIMDDTLEVISQILKEKSPKNILEIGTAVGYSAICFSEYLNDDGYIDTIEREANRVADARENIKRAEVENKINIYEGDAVEVLPTLNKKYDVVTLIGVLEYACYYIKGDKPFDLFLKKISDCLKPGGKLYVAIENKLGLKYFAGCCEDHLGRPFAGIEGYENTDMVKTFSKSQLEKLILKNGFKSTYFYYPFPDYKLPVEIYSDDYFPEDMSYIPTLVNYDNYRLVCFDESKVYKSLAKSEELKMLSNSFLVEAIK